mmetsp:Transcript_3097/g.12466  ORF Transcript_3097/g.12466 Transcript_3097/m.12466 type:complete len:212 (+) Transcript_3097:974-1609(+)
MSLRGQGSHSDAARAFPSHEPAGTLCDDSSGSRSLAPPGAQSVKAEESGTPGVCSAGAAGNRLRADSECKKSSSSRGFGLPWGTAHCAWHGVVECGGKRFRQLNAAPRLSRSTGSYHAFECARYAALGHLERPGESPRKKTREANAEVPTLLLRLRKAFSKLHEQIDESPPFARRLEGDDDMTKAAAGLKTNRNRILNETLLLIELEHACN